MSRLIARAVVAVACATLLPASGADEQHAAASHPATARSAAAGAWTPLQWKKETPSPFARVESPTAVIDGKIYLFGGFTDDLGASNELDVYDAATDAWSRKNEMPSNVTHLNPALDGNTLWLAGGFKGKHPGPVTNEVWKYNIAADVWTPGPPLPEPRGGGGLAVVDGKLHYFGGYKPDRDTNSADHWSLALNGVKTWEREADLPVARGHVTAAVLEGKLYALGGAHGHDITQIDLSDCERFDPAINKWSAVAPLPEGRSHFESSTIIRNGRILIVGGRCNNTHPSRNVVNDLLEYNPQTNEWIVVGVLPENVLAPSAAVVADQLIVIGGGLNNPRPLTAATFIVTLPTRN